MKRLIAPLLATIALYALAFGTSAAWAISPTISGERISAPTTTSATLEAEINPNDKATGYRFEYGLVDCATGPCTKTPIPDGILAKAITPSTVKADIEGLSPGSTYHYRVIAKNGDGETKGPDRTFMTYQLPQVFGACPNDNLRINNPAKERIDHSSTNLPDCRAYEQASPIDKGAGDVSGTVPFVRSSTSGDGVVFISVSGVPGGKGSQDIPIYLASRGSGWSTQGLLPPASFGQNARVLGWTPDFSDVFTRAFVLGEDPAPTTMLDATPPGSDPITVVPYLKGLAPEYAGASQGAQAVLFESKAAIPGVTGAIQGRSNVYLWEKASGQPSLAGVMNKGTAPSAGAFAGSYDWIKGTNPTSLATGGGARDYYTQDQNAIAKDASAVYFTEAGTGQLYVRINPTEAQSELKAGKCSQPALACTIRASESKRTILDPAGDRPAAFQGASTDGSKALFTSSQMLTNDANTGPEQEPAAIEVASRADGTTGRKSCVPTHATGVAVDSEHIYWVNLDTNAIGRAKLNCTDVDPVFIVPPELEPETGVLLPAQLRGVAVFGTTLYWTNGATLIEGEGEEPDKTFEGTIGRAKLNGTGAGTEVDPDFIAAAGSPHAVTANSEFVFWSNEPMPGKSETGFIGRAKAIDGGGANAELVENVFLTSDLPGIALDLNYVYWIHVGTGSANRISRAKHDGTGYADDNINFLPLGPNSKGKGLAIVGDQIYWTTQANELIGRAKLNGDEAASEVQPDFIKNANNPGGLAADATTLYWATNGEAPPNPGNDLYRYDAKGGTLEDVAPDSVSVKGADVRGVLGTSDDLSHIYFAANGVPDGVVGSPNARGEVAKAGDCKGVFGFSLSGLCNLYLTEGDEVRFIAKLDVGGTELETDAANWAATPTGTFPNGDFQKTARVTPDGQALLFRSQRQLTAYDNKGISQLYLYRAGEDEVSCVSCNPTSAAPRTSVPPRFGGISPSAVIPTPPAATLTHSLSSDGTKVFFETTERLVGADTNGEDSEGKLKCPSVGAKLQAFPACSDTYQWEAADSGSCTPELAVADGGCLYLLSTGQGSEPQMIADASADGSSVFFFSRSQLVGQDEDNLLDVYTARTNGGLVAQNQPPPDPCLAIDSCRGHDALPAIPPNPPKVVGPGNPKPPRTSCPKGKRKVGGRCVAKKKHKGKKGRKGGKGKANSNRRQGR